MFDIGWGELVLIGIVALIAIGPKELPGALRTLGQWTGKIRRMAGEFQQQFQEAMREAEMADLKKEFDDAAEAAKRAAFDPIAEMRTEVETAQREIESAAALPAAAIPAPDAPPSPAMAPAETAPSVSPPAEPPNTAPDDAPEQHAAPAARGDAA